VHWLLILIDRFEFGVRQLVAALPKR